MDSAGDDLVETLSGGIWTATEVSPPANVLADSGTLLEDVSCPSAGSCVAIGDYEDSNGLSQGFIDSLSGGTWTSTEAPLPANANQQEHVIAPVTLSDVTCPAVGACVVVGSYTDNVAYRGHGLIETLSGGTWTPAEAPLPANGSTSFYPASLGAITCPTAGSCVAVGNYTDTNSTPVGVIATLSGGLWTATEAPLPANASATQTSSLTAVTCPALYACVATGGYEDASNTQQGLLEVLSDPTPTISSVTTTAPTISNIALGQSASTTAAVTGNAADGSPTGLMSFYVCGPTAEPTPCPSLADAVGAPLELSSPSTDSATTTSASFTPDAPGYWCFSATYSGDATYDPSSDGTTDGCVDVAPAISSTVVSPLDSTIAVGAANVGVATVTGSPGGGDPTGTVSFYLCGPTTTPTPCTSTATPVGGPVNEEPESDDNNTTKAFSNPFAPDAHGFWCLAAYYSGGTDYAANSDTTTDGCFDVTAVTSSIVAGPTLSTIPLGHEDADAATVTGTVTDGSPTGSVSFYQCGPTVAPTPCTTLAHPLGAPVGVTGGTDDAATATSPRIHSGRRRLLVLRRVLLGRFHVLHELRRHDRRVLRRSPHHHQRRQRHLQRGGVGHTLPGDVGGRLQPGHVQRDRNPAVGSDTVVDRDPVGHPETEDRDVSGHDKSHRCQRDLGSPEFRTHRGPPDGADHHDDSTASPSPGGSGLCGDHHRNRWHASLQVEHQLLCPTPGAVPE